MKEELVGKQFRRMSKYGPSIWKDTITDIAMDYEIVKNPLWEFKITFKPKIRVKGSLNWYDIDEILIYL